MTHKEMIDYIGSYHEIDTRDSFGKYLILNEVLTYMGEDEAAKFMDDTLMILEDEVSSLFKDILHHMVNTHNQADRG